MGPVIIINPFGVKTRTHPHLKSSGFNPLAVPEMETDSPHFYSSWKGLGNSSIKPDKNHPHWPEAAKQFFSCIGMRAKWHERETGGKDRATLAGINRAMRLPFKSDDPNKLTIRRIMEEASTHPDGQLARLAPRFIGDDGENREILDVIATAHTQLDFLNDATLAADLAKHPTIDGKPFDFEMLKHHTKDHGGKGIITVYIILPVRKVAEYSSWLRMIVSCALNALTSDETPDLDHSGKRPLKPVVMLNEAGNLGYLEPLLNAIGMAAGMGLTIWTIWQSLAQISEHYGWHGKNTILSGAGVVHAFGADDPDTASYISTRLGNRTEIRTSINVDAKQTGAVGENKSTGGYPLMRTENVEAIPKRIAISWIRPSARPFKLKVPGFFDSVRTRRGLDPNPYYHGGGDG